MPSSKRYNVYYGQILEPFYKYFLSCNIYITPIDHKGNKIAKHLYSNLLNANKNLIIPDFKLKLHYNEKILDSYTEILFKGDYKNRYIFNKRTYINLEKDIHYYNKILENCLAHKNEDIEFAPELAEY